MDFTIPVKTNLDQRMGKGLGIELALAKCHEPTRGTMDFQVLVAFVDHWV